MSRSVRPLTTLALLLFTAAQVHARVGRDEKRILAQTLIRDADKHKENSLRDVLERQDVPKTAATASSNRKEERRPSAEEHLRTVRAAAAAEQESKTEAPPPPLSRPRTMSELFAWAIRMTTEGRRSPPEAEPVKQALPPPPVVGEAESLADSVRALADPDVTVRARLGALVSLEELCHSVDNGRDVAKAGGMAALAGALTARQAAVRAAAAHAGGTCCQNNPDVQRAAVDAGAVPALVSLAAYDAAPLVRARALFALNALLEHPDARSAFEQLPNALAAVHRALRAPRDREARATRRALNLAELLVGKSLETWKPAFEAWDLPALVARVMATHKDGDVRESAARVIATLDGRVLS